MYITHSQHRKTKSIEYHTSQDFYDRVLEIFKDSRWIKKEQVKVRHTEGNAKIVTDTQFVIHEPTTGTTRTSHIDNPLEIYAGLLYMRQRGDIAKGGDFVIYDTPAIDKVVEKTGRQIPKSFGELQESKTIHYKENTFVMFLNSNKSVHGVTPRKNAGHDRLSINIIAEVEKKSNPLFNLSEIAE